MQSLYWIYSGKMSTFASCLWADPLFLASSYSVFVFSVCVRVRVRTHVLVYLRSSWHPHAAHSVTEAMRPEGGHIILLDLHLVALEVRELKQADLVLHAVLQGGNETWDGR